MIVPRTILDMGELSIGQRQGTHMYIQVLVNKDVGMGFPNRRKVLA